MALTMILIFWLLVIVAIASIVVAVVAIGDCVERAERDWARGRDYDDYDQWQRDRKAWR